MMEGLDGFVAIEGWDGNDQQRIIVKNKELLAELKAYSDSLRQKVEAKFEGWDDSLSAISERRKKVLDPVPGYDFFVSN